MKASAASPAGISLPGWLVDILNAVISVISEVCQFYGGDKELCDLAEKGVRLLADTTIKKAKENVFFDKYSILPTLYFSNCSRYGAKKESIESYIWTSTILQDNPTYQPHERLFLLVSQTMNANNDSRAGQAWARTVEQLPQ